MKADNSKFLQPTVYDMSLNPQEKYIKVVQYCEWHLGELEESILHTNAENFIHSNEFKLNIHHFPIPLSILDQAYVASALCMTQRKTQSSC